MAKDSATSTSRARSGLHFPRLIPILSDETIFGTIRSNTGFFESSSRRSNSIQRSFKTVRMTTEAELHNSGSRDGKISRVKEPRLHNLGWTPDRQHSLSHHQSQRNFVDPVPAMRSEPGGKPCLTKVLFWLHAPKCRRWRVERQQSAQFNHQRNI